MNHLPWEAIPHHKLGETPEALMDENERLYRLVIAKRAILAGYDEADADPEAVITDLLTDLRHLCDALGLGFAELDKVAHLHYTGEIAEFRKTKETTERKPNP